MQCTVIMVSVSSKGRPLLVQRWFVPERSELILEFVRHLGQRMLSFAFWLIVGCVDLVSLLTYAKVAAMV